MAARKLNRRHFITGLCSVVTVALDRAIYASTVEANVARFGALPGTIDAGPGFAAAIAELARAGGGRLVVPSGTYIFDGIDGVSLRFDDLSNIDIEGDDAELVFSGLMRPLLFRRCRQVMVRGLTISWSRAPFSQGEVVGQGADRKSVEIALDESTPMDGWTNVEAIGGYDRETGVMTRHQVDIFNIGDFVETLGPRSARVHFRRPVDLSKTRTLLLRHAIYEAHAIEAHGCSEVAIEDVTVVSAPGMAFVAGRCHNVSLKHCVVSPRPGSGLFMSTTADGAHFSDCSGDIVIEGCRFANMGDDGVNVNTAYWRVVERSGDRTLLVTQWHDTPFQLDQTPPPGDTFEFVSGATLEQLGEAQIETALPSGRAPTPRETLRLSSDAPAGLAVGDLAVDEARSPKTIIRNCRFENNRARGVLVHKDARIENCVFLNQSAQGVLLSPDTWWMEGPEIANVQIVHNTFDGVDRWGLGFGAIYIDAIVTGQDGKPRSSAGLPNHDITIKDNIFRNSEGPKVVMRATRI